MPGDDAVGNCRRHRLEDRVDMVMGYVIHMRIGAGRTADDPCPAGQHDLEGCGTSRR